MVTRRQFIKLSSIAATLPLLSQVKVISPASAAAIEKVPVNDPSALALKYVEVASEASRTDKMGVAGSDQICGNCLFLQRQRDASNGRVCIVSKPVGSESRLVYGLGSCRIT